MEQIFCSNCGKLGSYGANYCTHCGAAQHGAASAVFMASQPTVNLNEHKPSPPPRRSATISRRLLCKRAVIAFMISYLGQTGIIMILLLIGLYFEPFLSSLFIVAYVIMLYLIASIVRNNYYFEVDETCFRKEYGVIHKFNVTIPHSQIQNVNITRSLTDRILGLAKIDIETAGSSGVIQKEIVGTRSSRAEAHLPGITLAQAKEVHDVLMENFADLQPELR